MILAATPGICGRAVEPGYIVKVDSNTVYLDLGEAGGARLGQEFLIYSEGPPLKHPITGEILGREETRVAQGTIDRVFPKYSIGRISTASAEPLSAGEKVRLMPQPAPPVPQAPATSPATSIAEQGPVRTPVFRGPAADIEAVDMAVGDVDGDGKTEILLADQNRVEAFPYDMPAQGAAEWKAVCGFEDKSTGAKLLSIDAADLDKNGKAEVFATVFNSFFNRVETYVLECREHAFAKIATLPWATRSYQDESGETRLAVQELMGDMTFPFGNIFPLEYKDGKYAHAGPPIHFKRLEWVYGFGIARGSDATDAFALFYTNTSRIRAQFKKGAWLSPEDYGQTSARIRWYEKPLMFYPRLILTEPSGGLTGAYTVKNIAALGGLAGAWGMYNNSEVHRLRWTGASLEPEWRGDLGGYAADIALVSADATHPTELLVAVVGGGGRTSILKFRP